MRKKLKLILLCICIILATGCSKNTKANKKQASILLSILIRYLPVF